MRMNFLLENTKLTVSVQIFPQPIHLFHLLSTLLAHGSRPINSIDVLKRDSLAHMIHIDLLSGFTFPQCFFVPSEIISIRDFSIIVIDLSVSPIAFDLTLPSVI